MAQNYRPLLGTDTLGQSWQYLNDSGEAVRTFFAGPTAPTAPVAYMTWADTTLGLMKQRNAANDAWIVIGVLGSDYQGLLPRSGGTMTGAIDMGGSAITNLGLATGLGAARAQEVALKAPLVSPAFQTDATLDVDPPGPTSLVRRSWAEGRYLQIAGGSMTGALSLSANATDPAHAVRLQQLNDLADINAGHRHDGSDSRMVQGVSIGSDTIAANNTLLSVGNGATGWIHIASATATGIHGAWQYADASWTLPLPNTVYAVGITGVNGGAIFVGRVKTNAANPAAMGIIHGVGHIGTAFGLSRVLLSYEGTVEEGVTVTARIYWIPD